MSPSLSPESSPSQRNSGRGPNGIKLTYFDWEGVAEKIRLALALGGIDFEDERVTLENWPDLKPKSRFEQLPTMKIGERSDVAESGAMLRYVGQLAGLYPNDLLLEIEEVIGLEEDIGRVMFPSFHIVSKPENYGYPADLSRDLRHKLQKSLRSRLVAEGGDLQRMLGYLESYLDETTWICGARLTIADCQVIARLRQLKIGKLEGIPDDLVDRFPRLKRYYNRFHELPAVKEHYEM